MKALFWEGSEDSKRSREPGQYAACYGGPAASPTNHKEVADACEQRYSSFRVERTFFIGAGELQTRIQKERYHRACRTKAGCRISGEQNAARFVFENRSHSKET